MQDAFATVLDGVKVLDMTRALAGPWCTQILADFGADVLKVEAPGTGDETRAWGPPNLPPEPGSQQPGASAYFLCCNRNKRSLVINIAAEEGADLVRRLAARADILVENFKVGGLKRYGLDYASVNQINPRLVYCSITGFGQTGPYADQPGYDFIAQAMGGVMSLTGDRDGPPVKPGIPLADLSTGIYAAVSVLLALRHAERTGLGQHIDISLLDTQIAMLGNNGLSYLLSGRSPGRMGNMHQTVVPCGVFETQDGLIVIAVGNDRQFAALCGVLGRPEIARDPRFATNSARAAHFAVLETLLSELIAQRTVADINRDLVANGVPSGPLNTLQKIFADPFIEARGVVQRFARTDGVSIPSVAFPAKLSRTPARYAAAPPRVGQHTLEALDEWLGSPPGELQDLAARAVIEGGAPDNQG